MNLNDIFKIEDKIKKLFIYKTETKDSWRSSYDKVLKNEKFYDDCDGLASTVLDALCQSGYDPSNMWRVMCSTDGTAKVDHMIGVVKYNNDYYIIGDTMTNNIKVKNSSYRIIYISNIKKGVTWKLYQKDFN